MFATNNFNNDKKNHCTLNNTIDMEAHHNLDRDQNVLLIHFMLKDRITAIKLFRKNSSK